MKIAIVTITHNRAAKFKNLINSIIKHTCLDYNIYALDNGTNSTKELDLLKEIKKNYNFAFFERNEENLYPGKARNILFENIGKEKYVVTLDDDIIVKPYWLEGLLDVINLGYDAAGSRIIQESRNVIHSQGGYFVYENDSYLTFKEHLRGKPVNVPASFLECDWLPSGCSLYKAEIIKNVKYDPDLPNMEDPMHCYNIKKIGYKLGSTDKSTVIHSHGLTANPAIRSKENIVKSVVTIYHKYKINVIKSWRIDKNLLSAIDKEHMDSWLYNKEIELGLKKGKKINYYNKTIQQSKTPKNKPVKNNNVLVSIVIPFRHAHNFLPLLIKSIEAQTLYESMETIIVNLGSRSSISFIGASAKEVIVPYKGTYNNAYACNIGAKQARGKYILFLSPDCLMHSNFISSLLECKFINQEYFAANIPTANLSREFTNEIMAKKELVFERYKSALLKPVFTNKILFVDRMDFMDVGGFDERFFGKSYEIKDYIRRVSNKVDCNAISSECIEKNIIAFQLYSQESMSKEIISHNVRIMASKSPNAFKRKSELFGRLDRFPVFKTSYKVSEIYS